MEADSVTKRCVYLIARGRLVEVGILADRLEETGDSRAAAVRQAWDNWCRQVLSLRNDPRRAFFLSRVEIAEHCRTLRNKIEELFDRDWCPLGYPQLWALNEQLISSLVSTARENPQNP